MRRLFLILIAITTVPTAADAQYAFRLLSVINPSAHVAVTESGAYRQGYKDFECISFMNAATKTATRITFDFLHFDAKKSYIGSDTLTRTGTFAQGATDAGPFERIRQNSRIYTIGQRFDLSDYKNCITYSLPREGIAFDVVTVRRVEYEDGSSWQAPPDATPSPQPSSSSSPD